MQIDGRRLNATLQELATIGATPGGGVTRLTLSDEDKAARDLLARWMADAGLEVRVDDLGNMSGIRPGTEAAPPVYLGSHIDTVVRGGKYDGALGVMGALEVIRTLNDHGTQTRLPVGIINWTNEEGVRFEPAMTCSGVVTGRFSPEYVGERTDRAGLRFADELDRIGYRGDAANRALPASAYLELHIEQGPVLESQNLPAGVVGGIVGITWNEVTITGQADHAGPSPMHLRRDALTAAAEIILGVEQIAKRVVARDRVAKILRTRDLTEISGLRHLRWCDDRVDRHGSGGVIRFAFQHTLGHHLSEHEIQPGASAPGGLGRLVK